MGTRIARSLQSETDYQASYVEGDAAGEARLRERGDAPSSLEEGVSGADVVVLAVPDRLIATISTQAVPRMRAGAMLVCLDPAAPYAGVLPERSDITVFVCHPAHPSVFNEETDMEARFDFFGSGKAKQPIVCALMRGPEADYAKGEKLARAMWKPVLRAHRVTVEQMAILEPVLSETVAATCITVIREAMDEAIRRGVPPDAARDFLLGHVFCELGIIFDKAGFPFSDGAKRAIADAKQHLFQPDWKKVFEPEALRRERGDDHGHTAELGATERQELYGPHGPQPGADAHVGWRSFSSKRRSSASKSTGLVSWRSKPAAATAWATSASACAVVAIKSGQGGPAARIARATA